MKRRRRHPQLALDLRTWGGARRGAGRKPKGDRARVSHREREAIDERIPAHVTLKVHHAIWNLRGAKLFAVISSALEKAATAAFRIVHFSVQHDHLHLIVEADDRSALSRGVQGLSVRIARGVNRVMKRSGKVFQDRFHSRLLRTPREVKRALEYLVHNRRKHLRQIGRSLPARWLDPCSSAHALGDWRSEASERIGSHIPIALPRSWLLRFGWTKAGRITLSVARAA